MKLKRPKLNKISEKSFFEGLSQPMVLITMSPGQWDKLLQIAYDHGHTLLELDENEIPINIYRKFDK